MFPDYAATADSWMFGSDVGPQEDGTVITAPTSVQTQPTDTAGGQPANYSSSVLDVFKFGIGAWSANQQQQNVLDYKRYEATNGGLYQQGRSATLPATAGAGGPKQNLAMMGLLAIIVFAVLTHKV